MDIKVSVVSHIGKFINNLHKEIELEMANIGQEILKESLKEVPIGTGSLKSSGYTKTTDLTTIVGYNKDYAIYVHEDMNKRHIRGKSKFLIDPFKRKKVWIVKSIGESINRAGRRL